MFQILKNSIDLLASRFVNVLAQLGIAVLVSRRLGPDVFGEFAFLNAVVMTGIVAANFGLDTYMVRDISRNDSRGNTLIWAIFKFKTVSSVIVIGAIFVLFRYVLDTRSISNILTLLSVTICLNSLSQSLWFYGDAFNRFRIHAFLWAGANLFRLGFIWLLLNYRNNLVMVVYAIILAEMVNLVISYATVKAKFNIKPVPIPLHELAILLKKSYPMALVFILSVLYFRIDLIMLKLATTAQAMGYYAASLRIVEFIAILPSTIYMAAFPVLSKNYVHDPKAFYAGARKSLLILGSIALFMALLIYFLSSGIIGILYGPAFSASAEILKIMTGVIFLIFFSGYFAYFHMAMENEKLVAAILVAATLFKTLSNYFLIPMYGPVGSAFAALLSEIVMVVLYIIPLLLWVKNQKHPAPPVEVVADERSQSVLNDCHVIILMGTYNGERYVAEQIQSIQSQSYENWQLLVRDDDSTDNTVRVLNTFQAQDDRIETIVDNKGNLGASGNFNQLCLAALKRHADVILFCDQDDVWLPDKIETQIQTIRSLEQQHGKEYPVLVYTDLSVVDAHLKTMHHSFLAYQGVKNIDPEPLRVLLAQNYIPACASASNRTLLQLATPIPDEALMHDWWFALCAAACGKIEFIPESMSRYRQHRDNAVGAKGLLAAISPFRGNMKAHLQIANTNLRRSSDQAQQLRKRIQDRKPGLHRESLSRINAYADCLEKGRVERIRSILKQGIKRQGIIYGTLFYLLLLISPGVKIEGEKVK